MVKVNLPTLPYHKLAGRLGLQWYQSSLRNSHSTFKRRLFSSTSILILLLVKNFMRSVCYLY